MQRAKRDMLISTIFFALGILMWIIIPVFTPGKEGFSIDSRFFPRVIAVAIALFSALLFLTEMLVYMRLKKAPASESNNSDNKIHTKSSIDGHKSHWANERRALGIFAIIFVYALIMEPLGYIISTLLAITSMLFVLGVRKIQSYLIVYGVTAVIYFIFVYVLYVRLP